MSAGLYVTDANGTHRPRSKKEVKEAAARDYLSITVENTSIFGGFSGSLGNLEVGARIDFVGPDPYTKRVFYGTLTRTASGVKVS